jgi:phage major head subunit gpT-like protein
MFTVQYLFDIERRMQFASGAEYHRLLSQTWYKAITKDVPMTGRSLRLQWLLDSAGIDYVDRLGQGVQFDELAMKSWEFEAKAATAGMEVALAQLDDQDGGGINAAAEWARQQGAYAAYWPQKQVAKGVLAGGTALCYDGLSYFNAAHPVNPFDVTLGTYSNVLTGAASGIFPGAVPIDGADVAVALTNLGKAINYISGGLTMPNGVDPRYLKPAALIVPTALTQRAQQLTNAKFLAQSTGSAGGTGDVSAIISNLGLGQPVIAPELGSAYGGSDTDYYIACETITSDPVGAILYGQRDPFSIVYNTGMTDAQLQRANKVQWVNRGRNVVTYGHPYLLFKCRAT